MSWPSEVKRWSFIFGHFTPNSYYFVLILMLRSFLIGLIPAAWPHLGKVPKNARRSFPFFHVTLRTSAGFDVPSPNALKCVCSYRFVLTSFPSHVLYTICHERFWATERQRKRRPFERSPNRRHKRSSVDDLRFSSHRKAAFWSFRWVCPWASTRFCRHFGRVKREVVPFQIFLANLTYFLGIVCIYFICLALDYCFNSILTHKVLKSPGTSGGGSQTDIQKTPLSK